MARLPSSYEPPVHAFGNRLGSNGLYGDLRAAILTGRLRPGARIPSSRELAGKLGVARGTVVAAFEQLAAEGYLDARPGSGTRVSAVLPDTLLSRVGPARSRAEAAHSTPALSARGRQLARTPFPIAPALTHVGAFRPHMPALQEFPIKLWATIVSKQARSLTTQSLVDGDARGHALLRCAIAEYLGSARGVRCTEAQVLVLASVQQGLDLATRLLLDEGDLAWCEDPGYAGAVAGFRAAGIAPCPIPVDEYGMDVAWAERRHPTARMAYVTPAHQAPLGVSLSLPRRLTLLDWARRRKAWIFEDDYDSEYRYSGKPLPPLQSLDENDCVLYAGCFSKTLFPALRIAYLVIPVGFADAFAAARSVTSRYPPVLDQLVLAEFMREGHYARHLRRMRQLYAERRSLLVKLVNQRLANKLEVMNNATGLNLVCWLTQGLSQDALLERCKSSGLAVHALSRYSAEWKRRQRDGLVLGFASMTAPAIRIAVGKLAGALDC